MPTYQRGSKGPEVIRIQQKLQLLHLYLGDLDGDFGGGTESAVIRFQAANNLMRTGRVEHVTWAVLFPDESVIPEPSVTGKTLLDRCLELTGGFETSLPSPKCFSKVAGNFDGQGISFGAMQLNLGQGSLQEMFRSLDELHPQVLDEVFNEHAAIWRTLMKQPRSRQLAWARSVQTPRFQLFEPWKGLFEALGQRRECQEMQSRRVRNAFDKALMMCSDYGVRTERAAALFFDIITQNGSISAPVRQRIEQEMRQLPQTGDIRIDEPARLQIIANRRAEAAKRRWIEDVRKRKLTIANGEGVVHGSHYHLEAQYGIRLLPVDGL